MSAIVSLLAFMIVASPFAFRTTSGILGPWVASPEGLATIKGLFLHAIVFIVLSLILRFILVKSLVSHYTTRDNQDDQLTDRFQENRFVK